MKILCLAIILWVGAVHAFFMPHEKDPRGDRGVTVNEDEVFNMLDKLPKTPKGRTVHTATMAAPIPRRGNHPTTYTPPEGCGWLGGQDFRNTGPERTEFGVYKWTIAIFNKWNNTYTCVGSLIHPRIVLSTGYWFRQPGQWSARAGEWRLSKTDETMIHQTRDVADILIHPQMHDYYYNIALLFLAEPFDVSAHIGVVCLPPSGASLPVGTEGRATGWGHEKKGGQVQDIMKLVSSLTVVDKGNCVQQYRSALPNLNFDLPPHIFCALGEVGMDTCLRDGGAPLVVPYTEAEYRFYEIGIVTAGLDCGTGIPGLYTDVASFRSWIDAEVTKRGYDPRTYTYSE